MIETIAPNMHSCDEDLPLVRAVKDGNTSAFEELVRRYGRKLFRIAWNVVHNTEDAEDAVQIAFLKAYQNLHQFQENAKFSTWLIRIALNECFMAIRKRRSIREDSLDSDFSIEADGSDRAPRNPIPVDVTDWTSSPESLYGATELREILTNCLHKLSSAMRVVFVLRDVEGYSTSETSEILNLTANAVKSRLSRARLQLREDLSQYFSVRSLAARTGNK
ncbi:MAG TPA: sigma-70 family RNA polymerase sigma factor [Terriglobales bacterium]